MKWLSGFLFAVANRTGKVLLLLKCGPALLLFILLSLTSGNGAVSELLLRSPACYNGVLFSNHHSPSKVFFLPLPITLS
jgi:hypothetical protein